MIDKLEFLIAVARERSFRRAADACGVAQPTLSAAIKQLEDSLGVLLIQRSSRFHGLTPEGEKVLVWARRLVGDAQAMRQDVRNLKHGLAGHLRLAVVPTALAMVPALVNPYAARHPAVRFTVLSRASQQILQMLANLEADAGITYLDNAALPGVDTFPLYVERYRLVTSDRTRFAGRDSVTWAEAGSVPLCLLTPDMQNRRIIDRLLLGTGITATPVLESNSAIVLLAQACAGPCATILPESLASLLGPRDGVRSLPLIDPLASSRIGLVVPHRRPMTALVDALVEETRQLVLSPEA